MARSTFSLGDDLVSALESLPGQVSESAVDLQHVIEDGSWGVSPDLSHRFAESLLAVGAKPSMSNLLRQAAECYSAVAVELLKAAKLRSGYAQLAVDSDVLKMREAMRARNADRWADLKD